MDRRTGGAATLGGLTLRPVARLLTIAPAAAMLAGMRFASTVFVLATLVAPAGAQISDARKFCAQVRNDDTIRNLPRSLAIDAMKAERADDDTPRSGTPSKADLDDFAKQTYFRCMKGLVFFCSVGANIPCTTKPDTRKSIPAVDQYCREERNSDFVPMAVTGHSVVYSWSCEKGRAVIKDRSQLDERGFIANIWTPLLNP